MSKITFIGIDPGDRRQPYTFAALDEDRTILALGNGPLQSVLAYAAGQIAATAAVSGPLGFYSGQKGPAETPAGGDSQPKAGGLTGLRPVEAQLALRGVPVSHTPPEDGYCPKWIRRAVDAGRQLKQQLGFASFAPGGAPCQVLEAQAEVCYWALLGMAPFAAGTLEGRLQRQLLLHAEKMPVPDPMEFFEEVTRFKLLKGILPVKDIYSQPELNALVAAYTAWLAVNTPERVEAVGDEEGKIWLPIKNERL